MAFEEKTFWLEHPPIPSAWKAHEQQGMTEELYLQMSSALRRPIYLWNELRWSQKDTKKDLAPEVAVLQQQALDSVKDFLQLHPNLPTATIRPMLEELIKRFYFDSPDFKYNHKHAEEFIREDMNIFTDYVLTLYRDGHLPAVQQQTQKVDQQRDATDDAVAGALDSDKT